MSLPMTPSRSQTMSEDPATRKHKLSSWTEQNWTLLIRTKHSCPTWRKTQCWLTSWVDCSMLEVTGVCPDPKLSCVLCIKMKHVTGKCRCSTLWISSSNTLSHRVHLSQHSPLCKEQRLFGVHNDKVEIRAPALFGASRLEGKHLKKIYFHDSL